MSKQLKLRRGTTLEHSTFTGAEGELTIDMTKDTAVVHDGVTAGGFPLARESALSTANTNISDHINSTIAHTATNLVNVAAGNIVATTVQAAINELDTEKQPVDATLTALAGVTTAADTLIYATAADTFGTTTLTGFGRTLIDDATAGDARSTLGISAVNTPVIPIVGMLATDVQAALAELDSEKAALVSPSFTTPDIGVATGTSFNNITALASVVSPMDGVATVGTSTTVARQDHVHPSDTSKQDTLVSGTTIKTINSTSVLGSGDIAVQATLVSGTSIKTVGGTTLLGSGDIPITDASKLPLAGGTMTGAITALRETKVVMAANDIDLTAGNLFTTTIVGATTLTVSNWLATGNANSFILELTNGGSAVVTWFSGVKWASGVVPTLTAAGVDILGFYSHDGGTTVRGIVLAKDSK
jgi:hypothetical protein